jgi:hypothetical protein
MEFLAYVGIGAIILYVLWFISYVKKGSSYINLLNDFANEFDLYQYRNSDVYQKRVDYIKEKGLPTVVNEILTHARVIAAQKFQMNLNDFGGQAIRNAENQFVMRYAIAHGAAEEFQDIMTMGAEFEKL